MKCLGKTRRSFHHQECVCSYDYYRNYTEADGNSWARWLLLLLRSPPQEGFREANSDYDLNAGSARLVWNITNDSRLSSPWTLTTKNMANRGSPVAGKRSIHRNSVFIEDDRTASTRFSIDSGSSATTPHWSIRRYSRKERSSTLRHSADT